MTDETFELLGLSYQARSIMAVTVNMAWRGPENLAEHRQDHSQVYPGSPAQVCVPMPYCTLWGPRGCGCRARG
jgi:hypothetical protein